MKPNNSNADLFVPDGLELDAALKRTTHMAIGAHQDDLELAMIHGILECFARSDRWFAGVTCSDGANSPRVGAYADYTDDQMEEVRLHEQRAAASIGRYGAMLQLGYSTKAVKDPANHALEDDLIQILTIARPDVVYTHNPADKHITHVAVFTSVINALRRLKPSERPKQVYGCETWRGLDWLPDEDKVVLDVSGHDNLIASLQGVYDSQIAGGKRYDAAAQGRFKSNATFLEAHGVDKTVAAVYAMDLMPLVEDGSLDPADYVQRFVTKLGAAVREHVAAVRKK